MDSELAKLISKFEGGATAAIIKTQTTYLDIVCSHPEDSLWGATYRIHFRGKRDFLLEKGIFTSFVLLDEHPLLLEYTEPHKDIYLSSRVPDKQKFISDLEDAARIKFEGWRSLARYVNPQMRLSELLDKSYGLLMSTPISFAEMIMNVAEENNVELNVLSGMMAQGKPQVLLMDRYYVVADSFHAEAMGAPPSNNGMHPTADSVTLIRETPCLFRCMRGG
jgi:hypothetical protein